MMTHPPQHLGLGLGQDQVADLLASAQQYATHDHGMKRFHQGRRSAGSPFLVIVNAFDGMGFALRPSPRLTLAAANDPPA